MTGLDRQAYLVDRIETPMRESSAIESIEAELRVDLPPMLSSAYSGID